MGRKHSESLRLLLFTLLYFTSVGLCNGGSLSGYSCREEERKALLEFKEGLQDPAKHLSSWADQLCREQTHSY
ncbi:hypothetical protein J5N97_024068 [Dioscorea zingiberensis]|uniref:Leucine-rich repeat-containing N-terminal plant-type domain-containing protein n=1 Tax=Dioscorea zingiberensis TaxID=325984 RepID=A0A9D5C5R2_9LILI|nr:hypothetical protein J5N97_024068 [Dioscorea zingiberensis]